MTNLYLTNAYIQKKANENDSNIHLNIVIPKIMDLQDSPYLLIIQSTTENNSRITIYPIMNEKIIKLNLIGQDVSNEMVEILSNTLKKYEIIHSSGILKKRKDFFYECYLNFNLSDAKSKDLKTSLDKIKNIFKEIKIEEIGLKN
ncbi:MAG: hypothetical protein EU535_04085 [Promethearchaeota archaeon]|nr:MAG: hypothetical protein EU535_04085 [Candidatus Lokiarchaeota archaeon]